MLPLPRSSDMSSFKMTVKLYIKFQLAFGLYFTYRGKHFFLHVLQIKESVSGVPIKISFCGH